ncbi:MAG: 1,2-phenylacetyl-CoA epoxidase subunit PaaD [Nocardioidaceae bacterium]
MRRPTASQAREVAATVLDPEMPMLSLADLGVLRDVQVDDDARVVVTITPTYSGCPAMATMRADLQVRLRSAGFEDVEVRTALHPAWSTDWISDGGRRKLREAGISPPGATAPPAHGGPVPLTLLSGPRRVTCPQCGSPDTRETSYFGSTACKAQYRCAACGEPFDHVKEI